jgi:cytidine deaminase
MNAMERFASIDDLDSESKYLVHKAKEATHHSYAPYSKFQVGAALILDDNTIISGANQENASYPLCMCAERVALYSLGAQFPEKKILKIAVVAHKKNHKELTPAAPCGACRQVLVEYEQRQQSKIQILFMTDEMAWLLYPDAESLLPGSFRPDHLLSV